MKLLMVIGSSNIGGAEKQFIRLVQELKQSASITLLVIGKNGINRNVYLALGVQCYISSGNVFSDLLTILKIISAVRPNAMLLWLYRANVLGSFLGRMLNVPHIVTTVRNTEWPKSTYLKRLLLRMSSQISHLTIANSQRAVNFHVSMGFESSKIFIIRNFIDCSQYLTRERPAIPTFGIAARAVQGKGHFIAIEALNHVARSGVQLKLSIVGFGVKEWQDLQRAAECAAFEIEILEGKLNLTEWFKEIDICLGLSELWDSDSNFVLEAISNHIPVICGERQSIEEIKWDMMLVDPLSVEVLSEVIIKSLNEDWESLLEKSIELNMTLQRLRDARILTAQWKDVLGIIN